MKIGFFGLFYILPVLTFASWTTAIVGLLALWARDMFRRYEGEEASVVFISDVGAAHRTFFIIFCALTAFFYISTTFAERALRHSRRIPGSIRKKQTVLDICSVVCAIIGSAALVLLSVFDAFNHSRVHWSMTLIFVVFVGLSVLFQVLQVFSLAHDYNRLKTLKIIAVIKILIWSLAIAGAVAFIILYGICRGNVNPGDGRCDRVVSAAAVCEWAIAFLLDIFFLTYLVDLFPAHKHAKLGLSEDGRVVENKQLAKEQGVDDRPTASYAIDGVHNNNTYYPSEAAQQMHSQHGVHPAPAGGSPTGANSGLPSERGSLYQTPMTEARPVSNGDYYRPQ
ncbi:Frag1/DRAM/Sfk1 [Kalmanozyma brasiliensis GHG001]|uniref:CWH43-like N-terminal domain-containing protein n=1 Tax=Kalmanozyma brasiliensis (strain GHG001) TaxID=1365824 RepID=V5EYF4_KALBG|nr:Frag1/DRAM/Sfk1 [Kalmanozyma brasiliensis GHG001]EST07754.1 Frag1/DRAM/Sfk1 [Kalmanozyma brasiliensis GHG001]